MNSLILFLKGLLLGVSMVLPGLSAGTIAFLLGIYNKLLDEVSKTNKKQIRLILRILTFQEKQWLSFLKVYDWKFILPILAGLFISILLFVSLSLPLIEKYTKEFYLIIFALVLMSLYSPIKKLKKNWRNLVLLLASFIINLGFFYFIPQKLVWAGETSTLLFLPAGFIVTLALVVPGLSGSYLLILLGLYEETLKILKDLEWLPVSFFIIGCILGLVSMSHLMRFLIKNYYHEVLSIIIGLILGSLYSLLSVFI